jgi:microcystin-dependent protein
MQSPSYIGIISIFGGTFAPVGWLFCDGSLVSVAQYEVLFSVIGTTYGGDGINNFALPDLRGRVAIHEGQGGGLSNYEVGQIGGAESTTLTIDQMPSHSHNFISMTGAPGASSVAGDLPDPYNNVAALITNINCYNTAGTGKLAPTVANTQTANSGGGTPLATVSPYLAMNYVICTEGIYPSRP